MSVQFHSEKNIRLSLKSEPGVPIKQSEAVSSSGFMLSEEKNENI